MRELSDDEVFGSTKELSDADVFGTSTKPLTASNYLSAVDARRNKDASVASWTDNLRDITASILKIGPTAVKGFADIGRLATADSIGVDTSNAMKRGMESIDQVIGSDALQAQKANINQALQNPDVSVGQLPGVVLQNPRAALDTAVSAVGSMALPTGAAVGVTKMLPTLAKFFPTLATVAPGAAATGASVITGAGQNAADTFAGTEGQSIEDRYTGAGISGAASLILGKLLGGGAEGVVARRMAGETGTRGAMEIAKSAAKTGGKEFIQEGGEESSNYVGQQVAKHEAIDPQAMAKQGMYGGMVGLGVGGATDVATNLGNVGAGSMERQIANEINKAAQDLADRQTPQVVQQTVARIFDKMPKLTPVADNIQLDKEPVTNGAANVLQPVDSSTAGSVAPDADTSVAAPQRVFDAGQLDLTGNGTTKPEVRTSPLATDGQRAQQDAPANTQPAADVAAPVTQPATLVATEAGAGGTQPTQVAPTPAPTPKASTGYIGQDGTSIDEGGTPFKSKMAAQKAKKLQPMMRVKKVEGGFVLADKTPAQLAAEAKAAKRISGANAEAGSKGRPMAAHEFIASRGGMAPSERSDLGIEGNIKVGNRWLFAGKGKGMTIAQATEALQEAGYIKEDSHNAAYDLIKRSVSNPQYTDEGWEQVAELERQTQFEDYLAQQNEAEDALGQLDASDYTGDTGYEPASEELQAEVRALIEQLEAVGIDSELLIDEAVRENANKSDEEYYDSAKQKLTNALTQNARSSSNEPDGGNAQGRQGQEAVDGSRADSGQVDGQPSNAGPTNEAGQESADQGLTSYTPQEIEDRLAKLEKAEQERKQQDREAEQKAKAERDAKDIESRQRASSDNFQLGQSAEDSLSGQSDIFSASQQEPQDTPTKPKVKIDDSGEVLEGARKLYAKNYAAKLDEGKGMDLAAVPLSKSWPEPDYQRLIDEGTDPWAVALARAVRDEVPTKPMKGWKLKGWVQQVEGLRDMAARAMSGNITKEQFMAEGGRLNLADWFNKIDLYEAVGHANSLKTLTFSKGEYSFYAGEKFSPPKKLWTINMPSASASATWSNGNWGNDLVASDTKEEAIDKFKAWASEQEGKEQDKPASKRTDFDVYSYRNRPKVFIVGKRISATKSIDLMEFETSKEANAYSVNNRAELEKMLAEAKAEQSERREENAPRVGEDHRNGADVTTEQFREAFGFRGEQFGASMPQSERQANMNQAYDALMDLAGVIGVPPKALSLNGELGLAFGARGKGGKNPAMAHYERDTTGAVTPNRVVINLTRKNGAGSLAHEWFHAVDNYFARMRGEKAGMLTESYPAKRDGVRPEMVDAFKRVMMAIQETGVRERSKHMDKKRTKDYWSTGLEMAARSFESYIIAKLQDKSGSNDYLANILPESAWLREESYPYPTMGELPLIRTAFDNFFATVQTKETDKGVAIFSQSGRSIGLPLGLRASVFTTEDEIEKRLEGLAHRPEVRVLDSAVGTLPGARDEDGISGANWEGRIYLFRDQLASRFDVQKTLFHELLHYGLRRFLTRDQFISQMTKLYERDAYIQAEADDWVKTKKGQETLADFGEKFARARGVDEALATLAEPNQGKYLKTDLFSRAQVTVTRWLAQLAEALGFKDYAAKIRAKKNEESRLLIQQIFTKLREDSAPVVDAWNDMAEPAFAANSMQSVANTWTVPEPGAGDAFIRAIQNNKIDLKRVRDAISDQYGNLKQYADAYLNEELYHGKVAARVTELHKEHIEPILAKIAIAGKNVGVTLDDVNLYLHARHAPERNAAMKSINPNMNGNEALSGLSDQEATKVIADFNAAGKGNALTLIAKDIDQLLSDTRTGLVADGLEDAGVVGAWEAAYKHYVPLQRDIGSSGTPKGMGFSVRGPEAKRAVGSNKEVVNILANIVTQAETAAIRAEKAIVGRSLLAMARQYPNEDFWTVDKAPTKPRINKDTGLVERNAIDPLYQTADNVMMVKDYGQEHFIVFNKKNERAVAVAKAMKNLDIEPMNKILEIANKGTRFLASMLTQRNPFFWLTNFARDVQGAMLNLEGTDAEGLQQKVMDNLPKAFKGMHAVVRGEGVGQWARYAKEMQDAGGTTGYMQAFDNSDVRMKDLKKEVARMQQGKADPRRLARMALEFVDDYNDIIENAVRLSVFQAAREGGVPTQKAASIAKNITVNFNRKGNMTPSVNALYMFFNASLQGTARLAQAVTTSKTARIAVGGIAVMGFMMDMLNRMVAGDDDETKRNRYDLIPEFEKSHNWIFMNPIRPGEYVKVPLPLGPHVFHNAGRLLSDAINRKDSRNASEYGWSMASIFLDAFSPMGQAASVSQLIAPSVLDPVVQAAENKSFTGAPVYKSAERFGKTDPRPAYTRYFENTPDVWKGASRMLNDISGGDKVKPGMVNIEPDIMKHVFYTLTGGPGRALDQTIDMTQAGARGKELTVSRVPLANRFYGANDDQQRERAYYDDRKRAADAKTQFDYYIKQGRQDLAKEVASELGDGDVTKGRRMMLEFSRSDKSVRKINGEIRRQMEREDNGDAKSEQLKALHQRRVRVMSDALDDE
jgi:hypothetical protein